jgi:hypothetical protein
MIVDFGGFEAFLGFVLTFQVRKRKGRKQLGLGRPPISTILPVTARLPTGQKVEAYD